MDSKIKVSNPVAELDGDEMTRVPFRSIYYKGYLVMD
jgi:hypothetical protein